MVIDVLLGALPSALIYSFALSLLALVLVVVLHRRKLYARQVGIWSLLAKLHYPIWVLVFSVLGFSLGLLGSLQRQADRAIEDELKPALIRMMPSFKDQITDNLPPELADGPMTGEAIYEYVVEQYAGGDPAVPDTDQERGVLAELARQAEISVRRFVIKAAIEHALTKAGERAGMGAEAGKFSLEVFKAIDFKEESDEIASRVTGMLTNQIGLIANAIRVQLVLYSGLILLLLLIEPLVYYRLWLPRHKKKLAAGEAD